jgi:hypothetical protein
MKIFITAALLIAAAIGFAVGTYYSLKNLKP